eukprot:EC798970.1.p2 GENE.EC798970.1~~EC798970.1.p2  ORF type:complete len:208 (+),score=54.31 EC798970.1:60-683(+)
MKSTVIVFVFAPLVLAAVVSAWPANQGSTACTPDSNGNSVACGANGNCAWNADASAYQCHCHYNCINNSYNFWTDKPGAACSVFGSVYDPVSFIGEFSITVSQVPAAKAAAAAVYASTKALPSVKFVQHSWNDLSQITSVLTIRVSFDNIDDALAYLAAEFPLINPLLQVAAYTRSEVYTSAANAAVLAAGPLKGFDVLYKTPINYP